MFTVGIAKVKDEVCLPLLVHVLQHVMHEHEGLEVEVAQASEEDSLAHVDIREPRKTTTKHPPQKKQRRKFLKWYAK